MALSNSKYDAIIRRYDDTRVRNMKKRRLRLAEVCSKLPEYDALKKQGEELSFRLGLEAINGSPDALSRLNSELSEIITKKRNLLTAAGYPEDYLEPIYNCPDCKDTGYINNEKCHCFRQAEITELYRQSNISDTLENENFSVLTYDYYYDDELEHMKAVIEKCRSFVRDFDTAYDNLLFFGPPGTGKTFLTNCITKELLDMGHSVIYFTSTELFDTLATYIFRNSDASEDVLQIHEDIFSCDLLVIDDLGTELTNEFVISQLFLIINERSVRKRSTIISTNLSMNELSEAYDDRIVSRIIGGYSFISPGTGDLRFRIKKLKNK